jgi:hypothetical protein
VLAAGTDPADVARLFAIDPALVEEIAAARDTDPGESQRPDRGRRGAVRKISASGGRYLRQSDASIASASRTPRHP